MAISDLLYPCREHGDDEAKEEDGVLRSEAVHGEMRTVFAQALSRAIAEELAALRSAWGIERTFGGGNPAGRLSGASSVFPFPAEGDEASGAAAADGQREPSSSAVELAAVAASLRRIARHTDKTFLMRAAAPPEVVEEEESASDAELHAQYVKRAACLEAELLASEARLRSLKEMEDRITEEDVQVLEQQGKQSGQAEADGLLRKAVAAVEEQVVAVTSAAAEEAELQQAEDGGEGPMALELKGELEKCLFRLTKVENWQQEVLAPKLEGAEGSLLSKVRAATAKAFAHLPEKALDPQRVLMTLP
jgi:hypothetical protein